MRDELDEPLGMSLSIPQFSSGAGWAFPAAAVLVAAAVVSAELAFVWSARNGGALDAADPAKFAAIAEPPPLRLTQTSDAPPKPSPSAALADNLVEPGPAKPSRARPGAPEPLIIDVQQALAALRAKDAPEASR